MKSQARRSRVGLVGVVTAQAGRQASGVLAARDAALEQLDEDLADELGPLEALARAVVEGLREGHTLTALARRYRDDLVELELVRHDSQESTAHRRLQDFVYAHVYGKLILEEELPPRIRAALARRRETVKRQQTS